MPRAIIAMSGGVDSSVAAFLMQQQGYDLIGITLRLHAEINIDLEQSCCTDQDIIDAKAVCDRLGIEHRVIDLQSNFKEFVIDRFVNSYISGGTPNPCVDCNRFIKFSKLLQIAEDEGYDYVVTGHYARVAYDKNIDRYLLKKGVDESKDQSYVLYSLTQDALSHIKLPLGELSKAKVREIAEQNGFINASKKDSQDICFVPDKKYAEFIKTYTGKTFPDGDFVDLSGNVLGTHKGIIRYTIGQRKGLNLSLPRPMYVCDKNIDTNTVTLCDNDELFSKELYAEDINLISIKELSEPLELEAKIRYKHNQAKATLYPQENGVIKLIFDEPQRAITKGQAVVMYIQDTVVGGGTIL
ncbi:MAG: tRNA 2-thiouridine(34) synthase MnmA [Ruminococcaceae bacterium]|nr:tRNA 2-thiouridine(34) synthase MnmA [Oscillospiraceae bacterium]